MPESLNVSAALTAHADGVVVLVHVVPGGSRSQVVGLHGDALRIKVAAPAVEGKANAALVRFVAELAGVRPGAVEIIAGDHSRAKRLLVRQVTVAELVARLTG